MKKLYIPKVMQAAVLFGIRKKLKVINLKIPELKKNQVLVKIKYSGICKSQIMEIFGGRENRKWIPHLLGHEATGEVLKVANNVKKFKPKDSVVLSWIKSSKTESVSPVFYYKKQKINSGKVTTFSNYSIVSENRLYKKPLKINFKNAVYLGCAFPTGAGMVMNDTKLSKDNKIVIIGLGAVGLGALLAITKKKINKIIVIDKNNTKLTLAKKLGVKYCFKNINNNTIKKIFKIFKGGADVCFESAGLVKTIEYGMKTIKSNGILHFASHPDSKQFIKIKPHDLIKGMRISGSWGGGIKPGFNMKKLLLIIQKNKFKFSYLNSKTYRLKDINIALRDFKNNLVFRPIIKMEHRIH